MHDLNTEAAERAAKRNRWVASAIFYAVLASLYFIGAHTRHYAILYPMMFFFIAAAAAVPGHRRRLLIGSTPGMR